VQQIWDIGIGDAGTRLEKDFTEWGGNCDTDHQLRKQGASDQAISAHPLHQHSQTFFTIKSSIENFRNPIS
jgi:hypothetical protein